MAVLFFKSIEQYLAELLFFEVFLCSTHCLYSNFFYMAGLLCSFFPVGDKKVFAVMSSSFFLCTYQCIFLSMGL